MGIKKNLIISLVVKYCILTIMMILIIFPFVWMVSGSLKTLEDYYARPVKLFSFEPRWANYSEAIVEMNLPRHAFNSIFVSASVVCLQILTSTLAAYVFAMLNFPGKKIVFGIVMATMMLPHCIMLVPLFMICNVLGISNTIWSLIIPFGFTGFGIFLLRQAFMLLPKDLFSAAEIDGAGYFRILWQIYLPHVTPSILSLAIIQFVMCFNGILWPMIAVSKQTLMILPIRMVSMIAFDKMLTPNKILTLASLCVVVPLIVFVSLQKYFIKGYVLSGIKG